MFARVWVLVLLVSFTTTAFAKRAAPKPVAPVIDKGTKYSADGDGAVQSVIATDIASSRQLWKVIVFRTRVNPFLEADVQLVFITDLKIVGHSLVVKDEKSRCYAIDLDSERVSKVGCRGRI